MSNYGDSLNIVPDYGFNATVTPGYLTPGTPNFRPPDGSGTPDLSRSRYNVTPTGEQSGPPVPDMGTRISAGIIVPVVAVAILAYMTFK